MPSDLQKIDIFFRDPELSKEETYSSLYKLRSDLRRCLFSQNSKDGPLLWPAAMLMLAGIDLMSSFYSDKPIDQRLCNIGQRYTLFCSECFTFEDQANDPDVLWKFRCALLHDYSIISQQMNSESKNRLGLCFEIGNPQLFFKNNPSFDYLLNISSFSNKFEDAIIKFEEKVRNNTGGHKTNFLKMSDYMGVIGFDSVSPITSASLVINY